MKWSKILLNILIIISILFVLTFLYYKVFQPAYFSYQSTCEPERFETTKENQDLVKGGETNVTYNNETNETEIDIETYNKDKDTLKHELCHLTQFKRGRIISCEIPITLYVAEVECYTTMHLRDSVFEELYNVDLDNWCN